MVIGDANQRWADGLPGPLQPGPVLSIRQSIVVGAYEGNRGFLDELLTSLQGTRWPVIIVVSGSGLSSKEWLDMLAAGCEANGWWLTHNVEDGYELGAFDRILREFPEIEEFLFLQDTFFIRDVSFIDRVMADPRSVALGPTFFHYAGKWKTEVLRRMPIPTVRSKREAVHWEHTFSRQYWQLVGPEGVWVFDPHFHDGAAARFETKHGRKNMVLENGFYRKYKADWGQRPL